MPRAILIAEKNSLMQTIKQVYDAEGGAGTFGCDIDFFCQAGHLVRLKMPEEFDQKYKAWSLDNYPLQTPYEYTPIELDYSKKMFNNIKTALKSGKYDFVIHAGDPDGEGELLVNLVLKYLGNTLPVKRFWTNDLTHNQVKNALLNLQDDANYKPIYRAALVRQHEDYQAGLNLTGVCTLVSKSRQPIKLGRVKAVLLSLIVDRDNEVKNWVDHSKFKRSFLYNGAEFLNDKEFNAELEALHQCPRNATATVTDYKDETKAKKAPKLFKLSTLQSAASSTYKLPVKVVDAAAQSLYEKKLISYPRTSCEYISAATDANSILNTVCPIFDIDKNSLKDIQSVLKDSTYTNAKAIAEEGHTGLIPTGLHPGQLSPDEAKIYELIARRFIAIFTQDKQIHSIKATAVDSVYNEEYVYQASEDVTPGYELVLDPKYKPKKEVMTAFAKGQVLSPIDFKPKEVKCKPPVHYTDGTLVKALESPENLTDANGKKIEYKIGTPATRSSIIEDCIKNGYFTHDAKSGQLCATPFAEYVVNTFRSLVPLFDITTTGKWEDKLNLIRSNAADARTIEAEFVKSLQDTITQVKLANIPTAQSQGAATSKFSTGLTCPLCGGNINKNSKSFYCSNYQSNPPCKFSIWMSDKRGFTISESDLKTLISGKTIQKQRTSNAGKSYKQKLMYNKQTNNIDFVFDTK